MITIAPRAVATTMATALIIPPTVPTETDAITTIIIVVVMNFPIGPLAQLLSVVYSY